jgi:hypothetical protein
MLDDRRVTASQAVAWLAFAATPVFALMAALMGSPNGAKEMSCSAATHLSPLSGMALMYALMSAFHCPPWLRLIFRWRSAGCLSWHGVRTRPCGAPTYTMPGEEARARLSNEGLQR